MKCPNCNKEMKKGYLYSTKDGAFSFSGEVPGAFSSAKNKEGFIPLTKAKVGGRASIEASICEGCRKIVIDY